jgi:SAM-dependent methyltransferase
MTFDPIPPLSLWSMRSHAEAVENLPRLRNLHAEVIAYQNALSAEAPPRGYSITAGRIVNFAVNWPADPNKAPNWRESTRCPDTGLIARLRAAYHAYRTLRPDPSGDRIYMTEGLTPFFHFVAERHPGVVGSEYLPDTPFGQSDARGVRSEDLTRLTFADASFDVLMSFEVLEHVPDYRAALSECARVLRPGGLALITAPFRAKEAETLVRASVSADGSIVHHEPPDYHGDPVNAEGILCYYWFGWSLLDEIRAAGFSDAYVAFYASRQFGYLQPMQSMIVATR